MMKETVNPYPGVEGVYSIVKAESAKLATLNLIPGTPVYGERLVNDRGLEYRLWDPYKSKLAAAILNGLSYLPIKPGSGVLYLGAATGTTVSHVSDIIGAKGRVYGVEFSPRSLRELISNTSRRTNVIPIFADARFPRNYRILVDTVDVVYCDIAQPDQAQILADNTDLFLKDGGAALLAIKARSIDSTKRPDTVFKTEIALLESRQLNLLGVTIPLKPYDRDHLMVLVEK